MGADVSHEERRRRYEALADEVWQPLHRYLARRALPEDAEDLLGEVLLVLWRRLDDVPADNALPWAYGVARGCLANARRGQQRQVRLLRRLRDEPPLISAADGDERVQQALEGLREQDREILRLWAWEGLEAKDLAVVLDCSSGTAATRLSRARTALGRELGKDQGSAGHKESREGKVHRP